MESILRHSTTMFFLIGFSLLGNEVVLYRFATALEKDPSPAVLVSGTRQGLWGDSAPVNDREWIETGDDNAFITVHRPHDSKGDKASNGIAVMICPGGGYGGLVVGPEGHGIAAWLNTHGITGIVLEYRLPQQRHGVPLLDAQRAIRLIRARSEELEIQENRIGVMGFSAGGHLASTVATHFDRGNPTADDPIERISSRPDFAVLVYPVVTMHHPTHRGSRRNLLGDHPTPALLDLYSNEKQVTSETPPIFLAHAIDDRPVPIENSRLLFRALRANGISAKLLELKSGGHGLNGYQGASWDQWQEQSLDWMLKLRR